MPKRQVQANGIRKEKMPELQGKHFSYNKKGFKAYRKAKKKLGKKNYSLEAVKMAKMMGG